MRPPSQPPPAPLGLLEGLVALSQALDRAEPIRPGDQAARRLRSQALAAISRGDAVAADRLLAQAVTRATDPRGLAWLTALAALLLLWHDAPQTYDVMRQAFTM